MFVTKPFKYNFIFEYVFEISSEIISKACILYWNKVKFVFLKIKTLQPKLAERMILAVTIPT